MVSLFHGFIVSNDILSAPVKIKVRHPNNMARAGVIPSIVSFARKCTNIKATKKLIISRKEANLILNPASIRIAPKIAHRLK